MTINHPTITAQVVSQFVQAILEKKPSVAPLAREICDKHLEIIDRAVIAQRRQIALHQDVVTRRLAMELMTASLKLSSAFAADYSNLSR